MRDGIPGMQEVRFAWRLPEGWSAAPNEGRISGLERTRGSIDTTLLPPERLDEAMYYLELVVRTDTRNYPTTLHVPFRRIDSTVYPKYRGDRDYTERDRLRRMVKGE